MSLTPRDEVIAVINGERDYQQAKWGDAPHSPLEFLVYMRDYIEEAMHLCSRNSDALIGDQVLGSIRKVTTLGVACMEQHGAPARRTLETILGGPQR